MGQALAITGNIPLDNAYTSLRAVCVPFNRLLRLAAKKGIR
jgi:hypothetical protein